MSPSVVRLLIQPQRWYPQTSLVFDVPELTHLPNNDHRHSMNKLWNAFIDKQRFNNIINDPGMINHVVYTQQRSAVALSVRYICRVVSVPMVLKQSGTGSMNIWKYRVRKYRVNCRVMLVFTTVVEIQSETTLQSYKTRTVKKHNGTGVPICIT